MKKFIYLLFLPVLMYSCRPTGDMSYKIHFTTNDIGVVRSTMAGDTSYTQFGDYITSLTPTNFITRIWTVGYVDKVTVWGTNQANLLQYIDQNGAVLPYSDTTRVVDFTSNPTVYFNPKIFGDLNNETNSFAVPQVDFQYFYFIPYYLYQEITLPAGYNGVNLTMFSVPEAVVQGNVVKSKNQPFMKPIFPNAQMNSYILYIFGNCDSTYIVNPNGESIPTGTDNPVCEPQTSLIIRSNLYDKTVVNTPQHGETVVMSGALSFNTTNLIQVYAGNDNVPYTNDDVFVYAPRFWERVTTRLATE